MADYAKDSEKQAALRRQIEKHPIWQYPPEERLQHNREWQSLYLLVFEFKEFLQKLENRLNNAEYDTGLLKQDEDAMLDARYTRRSKLRNKLDTLTFTEAMRKAVARYDASSGKEFMAYFDTIYANAMHEAMNRQSMREQGDIRLNRGEARLWKRLCELCDKQGIDPSELSDAFYDRAADILDVDADALKSIGRNATAARRTVSLNDPGNDRDDGPGFDMADPNQENMQEHLERTTEALRAIAMFASKDVKEYPRLFFTTPYAAEPVNYTQTTTQPTCYPITPILADTAHDGDEIKVIAVRQVNSPHSENLEVFRRELDSLGRPYTFVDLTTPENQQRDGLLTLFEALTDAMESDACYYADATFGTKTYPLVLSSALHYAEKILDDTEVCGIYYRELTRESGQVKNARQYDISTLFTLDGIVDMAADAELTDKKAFIKLMLHPDQEV